MDDVLIGGPEKRAIVIVDYDPRWPVQFQQHAETLARALGDKALAIEHVGSTSVPNLAAKPIIDIDVIVADSSDEAAYLPALVHAGYVLRVREPHWHQHRMFRTPELDVHVHIFSPGCAEFFRHLTFRDHLRACPEDRLLYESVKRKLAGEDWPDMNAYARAKTEVVEEILARALEREKTGGSSGLSKSVWPLMTKASLGLVAFLLIGCEGYRFENGAWSLVGIDAGVGRRVTVIKGADSASFTPINGEYAKDKAHVYRWTTVILGADPPTFTLLGELYSKDRQKVFFEEREIKGADPQTFAIVPGARLLSKDRTDFYFAGHALGVLVMSSFKPINRGWARDAKAYYATTSSTNSGRVDCDYATMKILGEDYAVDSRRAYYHGTPIEGVDVKTFRVTGISEARDQFRKYIAWSVD